MKKLQNNLYITKQGAYLHKERDTLVIEHEQQVIKKMPIHPIGGIFCFGNILVSPFIYKFCSDNNVHLSFYSENGEYFGRMCGKQSGNILLRRAQYHVSEKNPLKIAQNIVAAKITSSRATLQRHLRNNGTDNEIDYVVKILRGNIQSLESANNLEKVRGIEGESASRYFSVFSRLILNKEFNFNGRNRRPPRDPVNAMLSFVYSIFTRDISAALQGVGLDPQAGFLHADRSGRDSLALDILEEFRSWLLDRIVLSLINRKQLKVTDFVLESSGAVIMKDDLRKLLLSTLNQRKQETIFHPYFEEEITIGLLPHAQALLLSRHLRGDIEEYPPFIAR